MEIDEQQWFEAARQGQLWGVERLIERYQRLIRWRLMRLVPAEAVDDVAQEVFLQLARQIQNGALDQVRSVAAWLVVVARNQAISHLRAQQRRAEGLLKYQQVLGEQTAAIEVPDDPSEAAVYAEKLAALQLCLELLQPKYREITDRYYGQGQAADVIAVQTAKTAGAVRMILMRIRRSLAKCIRKRLKLQSPGESE